MNRLALIGTVGAVLLGAAIWFQPPAYLAATFGTAGEPPKLVVAETPPATKAPVVMDTAPVNPLHNIDVQSLKALVERPLFNPTRAPPPPVVVAEPEPVVEPEPVAEPEETFNPQDFTLLGVSITGNERVAVLRYNKTNEVHHLKSGQFLSDWELKTVEPKAVVIARADIELTIKLFDASRSAAPQMTAPPEAEIPEQ